MLDVSAMQLAGWQACRKQMSRWEYMRLRARRLQRSDTLSHEATLVLMTLVAGWERGLSGQGTRSLHLGDGGTCAHSEAHRCTDASSGARGYHWIAHIIAQLRRCCLGVGAERLGVDGRLFGGLGRVCARRCRKMAAFADPGRTRPASKLLPWRGIEPRSPA